MTQSKEISLPPKAEVRPSPGPKDGWVQICPNLWISSAPWIAEVVPGTKSSESDELSYNFETAVLEPMQVAQAHPEIATRVLARSRAVLDAKLMSLDVGAKSMSAPGSRVFPALNWPSLGRFKAKAGLRERHRNRSSALRRFLVASKALERGSEADFFKAVVDFSRTLLLPVTATLRIVIDEGQGIVEIRLQMEDPGLAIPGSGRFVLSGFGYRFEPSTDCSPEDLRLAYSAMLAALLSGFARKSCWADSLTGLVTVTVGETTAQSGFAGNSERQSGV